MHLGNINTQKTYKGEDYRNDDSKTKKGRKNPRSLSDI